MSPIATFEVREAEGPVPAASGGSLGEGTTVGVIDSTRQVLVLSPT